MSRRLPLIGSVGTPRSNNDRVADQADTTLTTLVVNDVARLSVLEARSGAGAQAFVSMLIANLQRREIDVTTQAHTEPPSDAVLVILGSDLPRHQRTPLAQALWQRADMLLSSPSQLIADTLAAAL